MPQSFDLPAVLSIQSFILSSPPWMAGLAIFLARWMIFLEAGIIPFLYFTGQKVKKTAAVQAALSLGTALALVSVISHFILRTRPFLASHAVTLLVPPPLKTSFPSGHTAAAFAIAFAIVMAGKSRSLGIVAIILACSIAFGRIAVGVHYPTDLLGGLLVGLLAFIIVRVVYRDVWQKRVMRTKNA